MSLQENCLQLSGNISILLSNNDILQGTFLGFVEACDANAHFLSCLTGHKKQDCEDESQFILLRLQCDYRIFPVDSTVAVSIAQVLIVGPGLPGCAPTA